MDHYATYFSTSEMQLTRHDVDIYSLQCERGISLLKVDINLELCDVGRYSVFVQMEPVIRPKSSYTLYSTTNNESWVRFRASIYVRPLKVL